jgi:hypothetical protein
MDFTQLVSFASLKFIVRRGESLNVDILLALKDQDS